MAEGVIVVTDADFKAQVLDGELPTVVDFWAEWCGPCRMVSPIVEELATEYEGKVRFASMNVDHSSKTAAQYGIMSIPTLILFKGGEKVDSMVGARSKADFKSWIDSKI